jgi:predicted membrane-bound spermidine synthase
MHLLSSGLHGGWLAAWASQRTLTDLCFVALRLLLVLRVQLSAAAAYFGLNEQQKDTFLGGYLMAAFFLIGAPSALLVRLHAGSSSTHAVQHMSLAEVWGQLRC